MAEDIFDVVDTSDNVVATAPRWQVHAEGLRHRASHIIIYCQSPQGRKLLLQKRSANKDLYPNLYTTSCSGHVDSGEDYNTAAVREMFEETGLKVKISELTPICKISPCAETGNEFTQVYEFYCAENTNFSPPPSEVEKLEWILLDDFFKLTKTNPELFTPSFLCVMRSALGK